ncbi:MAG TPA: chitobiase/beta-hexosaminidase C-terminal domain-containing protein, partial [Lacipirellulaceae bacterium]
MRGTAKGRAEFRRLTLERLEQRLPLDASMLRITEFLASNTDGIRDVEGDRPDWIELFNAGNEPVDLSGMYLTDDDDNLMEWQFPGGVSIPAGGYRLVFASNKDTVFPNGEIHTDFAISADGEFLALVDTDGTTIIDQYDPPPQLADISYGRAMQTAGSPTTVLASGAMGKAIVPTSGALGLTWTQLGFTGDAAWPHSGQTGFGYENNPGAPDSFSSQIKTTLPSFIGTAYIRVPFNLTSLVGIGQLTLRMKYDDGFVAYINGVRVTEANAPEVVQWDSQTGAARPDTQALMFSDFDVSSAIPHLRVGQNVLAIHALNQGSGSDMLMLPELVARPMALATPEAIGHFEMPTPGYGNGASVAGFTVEPTFDVPHGFYNTPQTVSISTGTPGAMIVYTTDGSTPLVDANLNVTNGVLYQNPLTISNTTTLRARAFRATYEPSHVEASSYIFVNDVINQSPQGQAPGPGWPTGTIFGQGQVMNYGIDPDIISLYGAQAVKDSLLSLSTFSI